MLSPPIGGAGTLRVFGLGGGGMFEGTGGGLDGC